jgi:hypothetical protein
MWFHCLQGRLPSRNWLTSKLQDCSKLLSQFRPHVLYISNTWAISHFTSAFLDTIWLKAKENEPELSTIIWSDLFYISLIYLQAMNLTVEPWWTVQKWRQRKLLTLPYYQHSDNTKIRNRKTRFPKAFNILYVGVCHTAKTQTVVIEPSTHRQNSQATVTFKWLKWSHPRCVCINRTGRSVKHKTICCTMCALVH